jgi:hypothetical protein
MLCSNVEGCTESSARRVVLCKKGAPSGRILGIVYAKWKNLQMNNVLSGEQYSDEQ